MVYIAQLPKPFVKPKRLRIDFDDKYKNMLTKFMVKADLYEAFLMNKDNDYMILEGALRAGARRIWHKLTIAYMLCYHPWVRWKHNAHLRMNCYLSSNCVCRPMS